jgi:hypothetical protein
MTISLQPVEIQRPHIFAHKRSIPLQRPIALRGSPIYLVCVRIGVRRQIDFRPRHMEKTQRIASERTRLLRVDDVVGDGSDARGGSGNGAKRTEGAYGGHRGLLIIAVCIEARVGRYLRPRLAGNSMY